MKEKKYIAINREKAKKGVLVVTGIFDEKVNLNEHFGDRDNIWFTGDNPENNIIYVPETDTARNLTMEEKIDLGIVKLNDGEYLANGEIVKVEIPTDLYKPVWNKENNTWIEGATKEELTQIRNNKRLEYNRLKEEFEILSTDEFSEPEEIEVLQLKLDTLRKEIIELGNKIKKM